MDKFEPFFLNVLSREKKKAVMLFFCTDTLCSIRYFSNIEIQQNALCYSHFI